MKAVVLAGGRGARLGPYTAHFPKPLMPLAGDMPVLELLIRQLSASGVEDVILAVNHFHQLIRAYFGDGSHLGVSLSYRQEDEPLGTAGPLGGLLDEVGERFMVLNGDLLTTLDFRAFRAAHAERRAAATIGAVRRDIPLDFGLLGLSSDQALIAYDEKPVIAAVVSMGCYVLEREAVAPFLTPGRHLDMPDLMRALVGEGHPVHVHLSEAFWLDIGRPDDYAAGQAAFEADRSRFLGEGG